MAALKGKVNALEMLLDKSTSLLCYEWLQQFVDESVPIGTVVEKIRYSNTLFRTLLISYTTIGVMGGGGGGAAASEVFSTQKSKHKCLFAWGKVISG